MFTTRRDIIKGSLGIAGIIAAGKAPAALIKSHLAARNVMLAGGGVPTAKSYVQDGLVAMWDGVENAGWGTHSNSTTTWVDLTGNGYDATQLLATGWHWGKDCYVGDLQNGHAFQVPLSFSSALHELVNSHTIEYVFRPFAKSRMVPFGQYGGNGGMDAECDGSIAVRWYYNNAPNIAYVAAWNWFDIDKCRRLTASAVSSSSNIAPFVCSNSRATAAAAQSISINADVNFRLGGEPARTNMSILGELCNVRVYNRPLAVAEMEQNNIVDNKRFYTLENGSIS